MKKSFFPIILQWDPMITTLPGLYMVTVGSYRPLSWLFGFPIEATCRVFWLRVVNVVLASGNVILIHLLIKAIHKDHQVRSESSWCATNLWI